MRSGLMNEFVIIITNGSAQLKTVARHEFANQTSHSKEIQQCILFDAVMDLCMRFTGKLTDCCMYAMHTVHLHQPEIPV